MAYFILSLISLVAAVYLIRRHLLQDGRKQQGRLPPGPRRLPLLGNVFDLPKSGEAEFRHWIKHRERFGPISSLVVLGTTYIMIHDRQLVDQLLQKESSKTSDRPRSEFGLEMCGLSDYMPLYYDSTFRLRRRLMHQQLGTAKLVARFDHVQEVEAKRFLIRILDEPDATIEHLKHTTSAIILKTTYGYTVKARGTDPLIDLIDRMSKNLVLSTVPWPVDLIPALKYLPEGLPGSGFKKTARRWKKINKAVIDVPYDFVRRQMAAGKKHAPCFVSRLCDESPSLGSEDEVAIKRVAAAMYLGGADTTVTVLTSFILAMMLFPEVQRKGQEAIDELLRGQDRLPTFADQDRLPLITAIVKETFRWSPVAPLAIPHAASQDLHCGEYTIPKGSVLVPMVWWFLHDPAVYPDPESFKPERYLGPEAQPDPIVVFGYGRRVCPGRYFAEANVFLIVARLLACFHIRKAVDEEAGVEVEPELDVYPGLHSHLKKFQYKIEVRDRKRADSIRRLQREEEEEEEEEEQRQQEGESGTGGDGHLLDNDVIRDCLKGT
ncbi:hypothetical protein CP532_6184 [Ophiocordyceps camponoti-leonardi (nom. inval.)]|nr:hypothetical protein CP532_6184 [Ophiocordyceps camponoti-leonardi (nom. inval.)]